MERRAAQRISIELSLTCRIPASPHRALIHDISRHGCKIEVPGAPVELGGTALLDMPGSPPITGRVVWVRGPVAGIQFDNTLSKATAVALGLEQPEPAEPPPEPLPVEENRDGLLRHWFRRLSGVFA